MRLKKKVVGLTHLRGDDEAATLAGTDEASLCPKVSQDCCFELKGVRCRSS